MPIFGDASTWALEVGPRLGAPNCVYACMRVVVNGKRYGSRLDRPELSSSVGAVVGSVGVAIALSDELPIPCRIELMTRSATSTLRCQDAVCFHGRPFYVAFSECARSRVAICDLSIDYGFDTFRGNRWLCVAHGDDVRMIAARFLRGKTNREFDATTISEVVVPRTRVEGVLDEVRAYQMSRRR